MSDHVSARKGRRRGAGGLMMGSGGIDAVILIAKYPDPSFFATTVNRAACLNLNKALAAEFGVEEILVNSVNIGCADTPQWESIRARRAPELNVEDFFDGLAKTEMPLGRFGLVEEVSGLVAFLVGARAGYITFAVINVAGGMGKYV